MSKIRVHPAETIDWMTVRARVRGKPPAGLDPAELDSEIAFHELGSEDSWQVMEIKHQPHTVGAVHAHDEDEVMYIVSGTMHFGNEVLGTGSSIFVPAKAYYGFKAGPSGVRIIHFRAKADFSFPPENRGASEEGLKP